MIRNNGEKFSFPTVSSSKAVGTGGCPERERDREGRETSDGAVRVRGGGLPVNERYDRRVVSH